MVSSGGGSSGDVTSAGGVVSSGGGAASGQNKFLEWRQLGVKAIQYGFNTGHPSGINHMAIGQAQFGADIKKQMLHIRETLLDPVR